MNFILAKVAGAIYLVGEIMLLNCITVINSEMVNPHLGKCQCCIATNATSTNKGELVTALSWIKNVQLAQITASSDRHFFTTSGALILRLICQVLRLVPVVVEKAESLCE